MYHPTHRHNQSGNKKNTLSHQSFKIGLEAQPQAIKQTKKTFVSEKILSCVNSRQ